MFGRRLGLGAALLSATFAVSSGCGKNRTFGEAEPSAGAGGTDHDGVSSNAGQKTEAGAGGVSSHDSALDGGAASQGGDDNDNVSRGGADGAGEAGGAGGEAGDSGCEQNQCGGCLVLEASPGDACEPCGTWECDRQDALVCTSTCGGKTPVCRTIDATCVACNDAADCAEAAPICHANACVVCAPSTARCSDTKQFSCNEAGSKETEKSILQGVCGAVCTPGALRCNSEIGEKCGNLGKSYVSSGSDKACVCSDPSRFSMLADGIIKDASTGLGWDFLPVAAPTASFSGASGACAARSMRLPTRAELTALPLTGTPASACTTANKPTIDSVAFPGIIGSTFYWTSEPNFEGYVFTVSFNPSGPGSGLGDRRATTAGPFICVRDL